MKPSAFVMLIASMLAAAAVVGVPVAFAAPASTVWSAPVNVEAGVNGYASVSCGAAGFPCFAVDTNGNVIEDPSNTLENASLASYAIDPGEQLSAISCPARVDTANDFCMAVDNAGNAFSVLRFGELRRHPRRRLAGADRRGPGATARVGGLHHPRDHVAHGRRHRLRCS